VSKDGKARRVETSLSQETLPECLTGLSGEERKVHTLSCVLEAVVPSMRQASFFFISLALHALALACPVSFLEPKQFDLIHVTMLPAEDESTAGLAGAQSSGNSPHSAATKLSANKSLVEPHVAPPSFNLETEPAAQNPVIAIPADPSQTSFTAFNSLPSAAAERQSNSPTGNSLADGTGDGSGNNPGTGRGGANGSATTGSGPGQGNDGSGRGANWTQARYRETPKPIYPETARRKGREGTVLLRVLVDDEGRAKSVEINKSSGDDSLDRAAAEAIQRWRFIPARHGEKTVESWIRIPVDFRLADNNSR